VKNIYSFHKLQILKKISFIDTSEISEIVKKKDSS